MRWSIKQQQKQLHARLLAHRPTHSQLRAAGERRISERENSVVRRDEQSKMTAKKQTYEWQRAIIINFHSEAKNQN